MTAARSRASDRDDPEDRDDRKPRHLRLLRWLAENPIRASGAALGLSAAAFLIAGAGDGGDLEIPRWARLGAVVAALTAPYWWFVSQKAVALLWSPSWVWLVELEAKDPDKGGIARVPTEQFKEYTVAKGTLDWVVPNLAFATSVDLENQRLEGTWRGTLTDRELLTALHVVAECRGQLLDDAKRGFLVETQAWTIVRNATRRATRRIVDLFEKGTLPENGEGLDAEIEKAIESSGLSELLEDENRDDLDLPDDWDLEDDQSLRAGLRNRPAHGERPDVEGGFVFVSQNAENGDDLTVPEGRTLKTDD